MPILSLFRKSPFEPLRHHMLKVKECVCYVPPMFDKLAAGDYDGLQQLAEQVFKTEHEADVIKDQIRTQLPKSIFMPVVREDFLGYLRQQDCMADTAEDIAVMMTLKKLVMPKALREPANEHMKRVAEVCELTFQATEQLKGVADVGFSGEPVEQILESVSKAEHAEWESDKSQYRLAKQLFALDQELPATEIFLWSRIFELLGDLSNHANRTCDWIRRMLAK